MCGKEEKRLHMFDRVSLVGRECVGGHMMQSPVGTVVAVNEYGMYCVQFANGEKHWYKACELSLLPAGPPPGP